MDKHFRLPTSKVCVMKDCDNTTLPNDEIQIPFKGDTLLLSLCHHCVNNLPRDMKFQSFSGNGFRYVEEIYPANPQQETPC